MTKIAPVVLVIAGLAVGLWLGFNPRAHQQIVQDWDHARTALVHMTAQLRLSPARASSTRISTTPHVQVPNLATIWKDITAAFDSLTRSVQRAWLSVTARIPNAR